MSGLAIVAVSAAGVAALAWLVVSFSEPGGRRMVAEWIGTWALYVALLAFFLNLARSAWLQDRIVPLVAFGFLAAVFAAGTVLSSYRLVQVIRGRGATGVSSATN